MVMRRVLTSLFLAGAVVLLASQWMYAQRGGHAGGGGHVGGFSGGGFGARGIGGGFGGSFSGPRSGSFSGVAPRSFPAPRMSFAPGMGSGFSTRPYGAYPQRGLPVARSPFGQLSGPAARGGPYSGMPANRAWNGQQWRGGDGHRAPYNSHYRYGYPFYTAPYYATNWWGWPWWPYFGNWDSSDYDSTDYSGAATYDQSYAAQPEAAPAEESDARPAYQPYQAPFVPAAAPSPEPALTIVYKDGHSQQVHNYALTQSTLLLLDDASAGRTQQVSLREIDLPATEQANRAAGVDFRVPVRN